MKRRDRSWMYDRRDGHSIKRSFMEGVDEFMKYCKDHPESSNPNEVRCPCKKCRNLRFHDPDEVRLHLYLKGFIPNYYEWINHGEGFPGSSEGQSNKHREKDVDALGHNQDQLDTQEPSVSEEEPNAQAKQSIDLLKASEQPRIEGSLKSLENDDDDDDDDNDDAAAAAAADDAAAAADADAAMDLSKTTQQLQIQRQHVSPQIQVQTQIQMAPNQQTPALRPEARGTSDEFGKLVLDPTNLWLDDEKVKKLIQPSQQQPSRIQVQTQVQMAPNQQTPASRPEAGGTSDEFGKLVLDPTNLWLDDEKVKKLILRSQQEPSQIQVQTQIHMVRNQQTSTPEAGGTSAGKLVLDPTTLWFDDEKVKKAISRSIQGYYQAPWRNYSEVDDATKTHWWNLFSKKFTWAAELDAQVICQFHSRAGSRLRDMFYTVTHLMNGTKPYWVSETVHKQMLAVVAEDKVYKKRFAQNKKNKRGDSMDNQIEPTHFQGSIAEVRHVNKLASNNEGNLPSSPHQFLHTHFKDVPGKVKVPANTKGKQIAETYQKKVDAASTERIQNAENEMYCEAVAGCSKKGRVKGLGSGAELYEGTTERSGSSQQDTPSVDSPMQDHFENRVGKRKRSILTDEIRDEMRARMSAMEKKSEQFMEALLFRVLGSSSP